MGKIGQIAWNMGKKYSEREKGKLNLDGLKLGHGWNRGIPNTWYNPMGLGLGRGWNKNLHIQLNTGRTHFTRERTLGEKNSNWKGGVAKISRYAPYKKQYREWKRSILERDDYKCGLCGSINNLEIDHLKSWKLFPDLRFEISNGRTLCRKCHILTPNYGGRIKKLSLSFSGTGTVNTGNTT